MRIAAALALMVTCTGLSSSGRPSEKQEVDLLILGSYVVTMDEERPIIKDGAVAVDQGLIVAVDSEKIIRQQFAGRDEVEGTNRVLMPGLINGHGHAAMTLFRGVADDLDLMTWLQEYIFPLEAKFVDPDFVRVGMQLACWEMIQSGITTFLDMYFYPDVSAQVVLDCGLRAMIAAPSIDFPSPGFKGWEDSFAEGLEFVKRWQGKSERIRPLLAPHAPYTVSPEHYLEALSAARELNIPISTHISEDYAEVVEMRKRYGTTSVHHLDALGLFEVPIIAAHVVWPEKSEIPVLAAKQVGVIHNPTSNLKTAAGISPVPEMLAAGVRVGLGTDGAASTNDLDLWKEMRIAALIHKGTNRDATLMPAATVLRLATLGGAEALGMENEIGSIETGKRADLIQVSLESPRLAPLYDIVSHLIYAVDASDMVTTIVSGKILMRDGSILTLDGDTISKAAAEKARKIQATIDND
jgi:5-methylthioadenosine/S-adenosylhomocysteine deaminase